MKKQIIITYEWTDAVGVKPSKEIENQLTESAEDTILMDIRLGRTSGFAQQEVFGKHYKAFYTIVRKGVDETEPSLEEAIAQKVYETKKEYDYRFLELIEDYQGKINEANEKGAKTEELLKSKQFALETDFKRKETDLERDYVKKSAGLYAYFAEKEEEINSGLTFARQKLQADQLKMIEEFEAKYPEPIEVIKQPAQFYQMGRDLIFGSGMTVVYHPSDDAYHLIARLGTGLIKTEMSGDSFKALLRNEVLTAIDLPDLQEIYN